MTNPPPAPGSPDPYQQPQYGGQQPQYGGPPPQYAGQPPQFGGQPPQYGGQQPQYGGQPPSSSGPNTALVVVLVVLVMSLIFALVYFFFLRDSDDGNSSGTAATTTVPVVTPATTAVPAPATTVPSATATTVPSATVTTVPVAPVVTAAPVPPPTDELDPTLDANFGTVSLSPGFTPDPAESAITSGGQVDVSVLGAGCVGFASAAPDLKLDYSGGGGFLRISFTPDTAGDTVLVINDASGNWICNDDFNSLDPAIEFTSPAGGLYDLWVASFVDGEFVDGTISITEIP